MTEWRNWAGNQRAAPVAIHHPADEEEIAAVVKQAAAQGITVKAAGTGHSFTAAAVTEGRLIELDRCTRVLDVDTERYRATV
jgi:L-gulono-1,4-lactone dehydrogenase